VLHFSSFVLSSCRRVVVVVVVVVVAIMVMVMVMVMVMIPSKIAGDQII
jgi:hypothetical protein